MIFYYTCSKKYLHDIDIGASDIDFRASYGQAFFRVNYIYIGPYDINIGALQRQVLVWVNDIGIEASYIDIGAYYIDIGSSWVAFGPYNTTLLIALALLPVIFGYNKLKERCGVDQLTKSLAAVVSQNLLMQ